MIFIALLALLPSVALAHPGNTDSNGGHHCWTNCATWGYSYGEYHFHENNNYVSPNLSAVNYTENSKLNMLKFDLLSNETFCSTAKSLIENEIDYSFSQMSLLDKSRMSLDNGFNNKCEQNSQCAMMKSDIEDAIATFVKYIGDVSLKVDKRCGTQLAPESLQRIVQWTHQQHEVRQEAQNSSIRSTTFSSSSASSKNNIQKAKNFSSYKSKIANTNSSSNAINENMYERVCPRVVKRFLHNEKMWNRVNERIQKRFGFVCSKN